MNRKYEIESDLLKIEQVSDSCNLSAFEGNRSWMGRSSVRAGIKTLLDGRNIVYRSNNKTGNSLPYYWLPSKGGDDVYLIADNNRHYSQVLKKYWHIN